jgi:hypothetical protein
MGWSRVAITEDQTSQSTMMGMQFGIVAQEEQMPSETELTYQLPSKKKKLKEETTDLRHLCGQYYF